MNQYSQLTSAVLQAATVLPVIPTDLAPRLDALKARADQEPPRDPEDELAAALAGEMGPYMQQIAEQIVNGQQPDTSEMDKRILVLLLLGLLGATAANAMQRGQALGIELSVTDINQAARDWAQGYSYNQVRGITETTQRAIADAVSTYTRNPGMTVDDVAKLLQPTFGEARARMIATTEITRAYGQAAVITTNQLAAQGITTLLQWVTWRDDRVCPICGPLHNTYANVWQAEFPYGPPAHVNCVLPGQEVAVPGLSAGAKSFYQGRVIQITTRNGHSFAVTENHPVLTAQGWLAAKFISKGDNLFAHSAVERVASSVYPNYDHRPAMIEQIFSALGMTPGMSTVSVPSSPVDFYGDGRKEGYIDIVGPYRELMVLDKVSIFQQPVVEGSFGIAYPGLVYKSGYSAGAFLGEATRPTANGFMGAVSKRDAFSGGQLGHTHRVGFASVPTLDTDFVQYLVDSPSIDTEPARQFIDRHTGYISTDEVVNVLSREYSGHVYDLQSDLYGLYTINGIIAKNCRCWLANVRQ